MKRGEIWWADLGEPRGSEPGFTRPVLVVQADAFNNSQLRTVVVAGITSNLRLAEAPGNVRLSAKKSGLSRESTVNVSQLITLDKTLLRDRVGKLDKEIMDEINDGLLTVLGVLD